MRKTLVLLLLVSALLLVQVHAKEDDEHDHDDIDHHSHHKHESKEDDEDHETGEDHSTDRRPEPRVNAVLQNTQPIASTTKDTTHHEHHTHHHHHHDHHHNSTTEEQKQRAVTCLPRSITARIRDLLVDELTVVILYELKKNATIPSDITFENYLVECLKHVKMEVKINNYPYKNVTVLPGSIMTTNQVSSLDDLPHLSTFDLKIGIAQNRIGEAEYFTDQRQTKTCYGAPSPVNNLRRSMLANGSLWIEWEEPSEKNAPSICYYQVRVRDLNTNTEKVHTLNERTFMIPKEELKPQLRITVYAFNTNSCYLDQYPFVSECRKNDLGSAGQVLEYRPNASTTKKPNGADQLKHSSFLLMVPLLTFLLAKY